MFWETGKHFFQLCFFFLIFFMLGFTKIRLNPKIPGKTPVEGLMLQAWQSMQENYVSRATDLYQLERIQQTVFHSQ